MLRLFVSENQEINAVIRQLKLIKIRCSAPFNVYQGDTALLCRMPARPAGTAAAVGSLLTAFPFTTEDLLVSLGQSQPLHQNVPDHWVLCTGVRGTARRQTDDDGTAFPFSWYPDLMFSHPFSEGGIVSEPPGNPADSYWMFYDPCAFSFIQAAGYFASPHQIIMLRCRDFHTGLLPEILTPLLDWCVRTAALPFCETAGIAGLTQTEQEETTRLAAQMRLSQTMALRLRQLLIFHKLQSGGVWNGLEDIRKACERMPCHSKTEGKKQFEQLRKRILL